MMIARSVGIHDGLFHADEVTACALLLQYDLIDRSRIMRTRDIQQLAQCEYVCDVGGEYNPEKKRFDHHQVSYQGEWSSAGMVWAYLHQEGKVDEDTYKFLCESLIIGVDAHDNGVMTTSLGTCTFSQIISNFTPIRYDVAEEELQKAFNAALDFVLGHIGRLLERRSYIRSCRQKVALAMEKKQSFLLFSESMPWLDSFFELGGEMHPAQFVIMPSGTQWKLRGIPPSSIDRMKVRKELPKEWAGLLEEDLKKSSGIDGAVFCHKGRFISVWKTKNDALTALQKVLSE